MRPTDRPRRARLCYGLSSFAYPRLTLRPRGSSIVTPELVLYLVVALCILGLARACYSWGHDVGYERGRAQGERVGFVAGQRRPRIVELGGYERRPARRTDDGA